MSDNRESRTKQLADWFYRHLKLSQEDAIAAAVFATGGFTVDAWFFPGGMPPGTVTILSGVAGMITSKVCRCRRWYQRRILMKIDKYWPAEEREEVKARLRRKWEEECLGLPPTSGG